MQRFDIELTNAPISPGELRWNGRHGAHIAFYGVVRDHEDGAPIQGIDYSAYGQMARRSLEELGKLSADRFCEHSLRIIHRIGFVPIEEPSLYLEVSAAHSAEALEICQWCLAKLKADVPIWKRIVTTAAPTA